MKKLKKTLSAFMVLLTATQCSSATGFAADINKPSDFENVYVLSQKDESEYGYKDYFFVDQNGNDIVFDNSTNTNPNTVNPLNSLSGSDSELPSKYSLRDNNTVTDARAQGSSSSCWAFATLGAIESNAVTQGIKAVDETDFSEAHLVWFAQNSATADKNSPAYGDGISRPDAYSRGGNWMLALSALSRWSGTVNEADYPFYPNNLSAMGNYAEGERQNKSGGVIINSAESLASHKDIKSWIMKNGAVEISYYHNEMYSNKTADNYSYYCNDSSQKPNHAVLIVGWDDYYSKSNFNSSIKPTCVGAFLCKNSWGSNFGDNGYFWLSYHDATISNAMGYTCVESDTYDNNYTYNGLSYGGMYKNSSPNGSQIANIFKSKGHETLSAVSTYTLQPNTYVEVFIYKNLPSNYSKPTQGTLVYSSEEIKLTNAGYHTITIDEPVNLLPDEIFSVVIRLSINTNLLYVVGEYNDPDSKPLYSSKVGQSFIDLSGTNANWNDSTLYGWNNNYIQAFTVCKHQVNETVIPSDCKKEGAVINYCSQCNKQISSYSTPVSDHEFSSWTTIKPATKTSEGKKEHVCIACGYSETEITPKLPYTGEKVVKPAEFFEIFMSWFNDLFIQIQNRYEKKGFSSY